MSSDTITTTLNQPYPAAAVGAVRSALRDQRFDMITEIVLGACRPPSAYEAIQAEPSIAALLQCNDVVRSLDSNTTVVEAFDPDATMGLADNDALHTIATDAKQQINVAFAALNEVN